jgi:dienelactone hydrolase
VARFGRRVADAGFTAWLPQLFGTPGREIGPAALTSTFAQLCISREWHLLSTDRPSPICDRLRALGRVGWERCGGPGIGAIGMCVTGNFALTLALDPHVLAPVLCQPSLPLGVTPGRRRALHAAPGTLDAIRARAQPVSCVRFLHDRLVPQARIDALRDALGDLLHDHNVDSSPGNPHGIGPRAHSALTNDLVDREGHPTRAALDAVLGFLRDRLLP